MPAAPATTPTGWPACCKACPAPAPAQPIAQVHHQAPVVLYEEGAPTASARALAAPPGGRVLARLGDDLLGLDEGGSLRIEAATTALTRLALDAGSVAIDAAPRAAGASLEILAGDHAVRVIGTRFRVERGETFRVLVEEGVVEVLGEGGPWRVRAGERLERGADGAARVLPLEEDLDLKRLLTPRRWSPPPTAAPDIGHARRALAPDISSVRDLKRALVDGRLAEATAGLRAHLERDPADLEAWRLLALARRKAGDPAGALAAHQVIVARGSGAARDRARYEAALLHVTGGDHAAAIALLTDWLASPTRATSQEPEARLGLGRALLATGQIEEGEAALRALVAEYGSTTAGAAARGALEAGR